MSGRLEWVKAEVGETTVMLPWTVRDELLERALKAPGTEGVRTKLEAVGATRPAVLDDAAELLALRAVVSGWERDGAPEEIVGLGAAIDVEVDRIRAEAADVGIGTFEEPLG